MAATPTPASAQDETHVSFFQIAILVLSVLVLAALLVDTSTTLPKETSRLINILDAIVCALFFTDFCIRFYRTQSKLQFMKWGWIDLLASIPNIDALRWGRLVRILRIIRLLRAVRSFQRILALIFHNKLKSGLGSVALITFLLIFFSSIAILTCETDSQSNIKTAEDAVWWSITTITTVGYGDKFPLTTEGRLIAMVLMVSGVGLFGTLSGLVASYFLGQQKQPQEDPLALELKSLHAKLDDLHAKLDSDKIDRI